MKRAAIFSLLHIKTAQEQNGRPDGNRAPQAPTDAPMRPLGTLSLIHHNKPETAKPVKHTVISYIYSAKFFKQTVRSEASTTVNRTLPRRVWCNEIVLSILRGRHLMLRSEPDQRTGSPPKPLVVTQRETRHEREAWLNGRPADWLDGCW